MVFQLVFIIKIKPSSPTSAPQSLLCLLLQILLDKEDTHYIAVAIYFLDQNNKGKLDFLEIKKVLQSH